MCQHSLHPDGFEKYRKPTSKEVFPKDLEQIILWKELCQVLNPTISRRKVQVDDHWNLRLLKMNNRTSLLTTTGPDQDISFRTSHFVDISGQLETKLAALESYAEEMRDFPHPRCRCEPWPGYAEARSV